VADRPEITPIMEARAMLLDLLLSPYTQTSAWNITRACIYLDHPKRPSGVQCICGRERFGVLRPTRETG
jgi:hypothetical protein